MPHKVSFVLNAASLQTLPLMFFSSHQVLLQYYYLGYFQHLQILGFNLLQQSDSCHSHCNKGLHTSAQCFNQIKALRIYIFEINVGINKENP